MCNNADPTIINNNLFFRSIDRVCDGKNDGDYRRGRTPVVPRVIEHLSTCTRIGVDDFWKRAVMRRIFKWLNENTTASSKRFSSGKQLDSSYQTL